MLRGKLFLFGVLMALVVAATWSGLGIAAEAITPDNVGTAVANAKTAQDYQALSDFYTAQATAAKEQADKAKAQFDTIHKAKGLRTGPDQEIIQQQTIFTKRTTAHYLGIAAQDTKLAKMYGKRAKSAGAAHLIFSLARAFAPGHPSLPLFSLAAEAHEKKSKRGAARQIRQGQADGQLTERRAMLVRRIELARLRDRSPGT